MSGENKDTALSSVNPEPWSTEYGTQAFSVTLEGRVVNSVNFYDPVVGSYSGHVVPNASANPILLRLLVPKIKREGEYVKVTWKGNPKTHPEFWLKLCFVIGTEEGAQVAGKYLPEDIYNTKIEKGANYTTLNFDALSQPQFWLKFHIFY